MNKRSKVILVVVGSLFLMEAPLCIFAAGAYSSAHPPLYQSATIFELSVPAADIPRLQGAFQRAQQQYPARMQAPLSARVNLQPLGNQNLYSITAIDADPLVSASAANALTLLVRDKLEVVNKDEDLVPPRVRIWERAEPPIAPSFPKVPIMMVGAAAAGFCGAAGFVFLLIGLAQRTSDGTMT